MTTTAKPSKGYVGILGLATLLILFSVLTKQWWREAGGSLHIGPRGWSERGASGSLDKLDGTWGGAGLAVLLLGLLSALTCLVAAASPKHGIKAVIATWIFIFVGLLFLGSVPTEQSDYHRLEMAAGFPAAVLAGLFAVIGGVGASRAAARAKAA